MIKIDDHLKSLTVCNNSKMSRSFGKTPKLSKELESVLSLRKEEYAEIPKVKTKLDNIAFFNKVVTIEKPSNRTWREIEHVTSSSEGWNSGKKKKGGKPTYSGGGGAAAGGAGTGGHNVITHYPTSKSALTMIKESKSISELIMDRIRGKINKLCRDSYKETYESISIVLDSGEVEFISNFIKEVFQCAANQTEVFCKLYANLLHELAEKYTQIRDELNMLFNNYILAFDETTGKPDVGTEDYLKFIAAQEAKRYRKGYSQFVGELVKLGEINIESFIKLVCTMIQSINVARKVAENTLVCEEYSECFKVLCIVGCNILKSDGRSVSLVELVRTIIKDPKSENPGLTNKAKFALMDVEDLVKRGWVPK
jgi:hypothetical protein